MTETDGLVGLGPAVWSVDAGDTIAELVWSPTDERLAVGCSGGDVVVFDKAGLVIDRRLRHPSGTSCVTWFGGDVASGGVDGWVDVGGHRERLGGWVSALASSEPGLGVAHGRHISILGGPSSERLPASIAQIRWATGPGVTQPCTTSSAAIQALMFTNCSATPWAKPTFRRSAWTSLKVAVSPSFQAIHSR